MSKGVEIRSLERETTGYELREAESGGSIISGYGAIFDSPTVIGGRYTEEISRSAFKKTVSERDVQSYFNHNPDNFLASVRSGTLSFASDDTGLLFHDELPNTVMGDTVRELIATGRVWGSSFMFSVVDDELVPATERSTGMPHRIIKEVKLFEVGPVSMPAYDNTSVGLRAADVFASEVNKDFEDVIKRFEALESGNKPEDDIQKDFIPYIL